MSDHLPRNFKGIWIPKSIWLHTELSFFEKILWAEIDSLDHEQRGCTASNDYLANFFQVKERVLQRALSNLKSKQLITYWKFDGRVRSLTTRFIRGVKNDTPEVSEENRGVKNDTPKVIEMTPLPKGTIDIEQSLEQRKEIPPQVGIPPSLLSKEKKEISQEANEIADLLLGKIRKIHPTLKQPNLKEWSRIIDKCHRIDHRSWDDLRAVIDHAFDRSDFWPRNLQSAEGLRRNFDTIWLQMIPIENEATRIIENRKFAFYVKGLLDKKNQSHLLIIHKQSVCRQSGDSISMDLPPETFESILAKWFGLRVK